MKILPDADKAFLHHVAGVLLIGQKPKSHIKDKLLMFFNDLTKSVKIAVLRLYNELLDFLRHASSCGERVHGIHFMIRGKRRKVK